MRKSRIPSYVREEVWSRYGGELCWCCQTHKISVRNKHMGHIIAEANGGTPTVDNLRPVCSSCNLRMRTQNMYDFMVAEGYPLRDVTAVYRILQKDPEIIPLLKNRHVYAVPTLTKTGCPTPKYDYVLTKPLLVKYPFLRPIAARGRLGMLFATSVFKGITFHFIVRPDFVRWVRHRQEQEKMDQIEREILGK